MNKLIIERQLAGYAAAHEIAEAERRARLKTMTEAEARTIFDDLCASWERLGKNGGNWDRLNRWRIEQKISLRHAFKRLASAKRLI